MTHNPEDHVFYVYKWIDLETNEIIYIGKGAGDRWRETRKSRRNKYFYRYISKHKCKSFIILNNLTEKEAYDLEEKLIIQYKKSGQCFLNFDNGGRRGGRSPGETNGMWGKTHTPEAIEKIRLANINRTKELNNNARLCQILDLNHNILYEFNCVIDLTNKFIELHEKEFNQKYTFSTARTYVDRVKNKEKALDNKYYIRIFRKNYDDTVPSLE